MTYTNDPEQLRRDIERTQRNLSTDVDLLSEKVTPGRIVQRRMNRARRSRSACTRSPSPAWTGAS